MKKLLFFFGLSLIGFLISAGPAKADNSVCNRSCQVTEDCGAGYRCYVGVCRAYACPSSPNCACVSATPTPVPTPKIENLRVVPTPAPKATPIASPSSQIKKAPSTGSSAITFIYISAAAGLMGLFLKNLAK